MENWIKPFDFMSAAVQLQLYTHLYNYVLLCTKYSVGGQDVGTDKTIKPRVGMHFYLEYLHFVLWILKLEHDLQDTKVVYDASSDVASAH